MKKDPKELTTFWAFNFLKFKNKIGETWIYPPRPSQIQMELFGEIVRECRRLGINENGIEIRVGNYWVDIAIYYREYKIAIEVYGAYKKEKISIEKKTFLERNGWKIICIPAEVANKDSARMAKYIVGQIIRVIDKVG